LRISKRRFEIAGNALVFMKAKNSLEEIDKHIQLTDDILKLPSLLDQHLKPCRDDLVLLTLKGHLIIESLLEMNLSRLLDVESWPQKGVNKKSFNMSFFHKLTLVGAVVSAREPGPNADLILAIDALNDMRNKLAHNLKIQSEIEKDVKLFVEEYCRRAGVKVSLDKSTADQLRSCIHRLCAFLYRVRIHFFKLERQSDE
jgi:hypothetical protein